MSHPPTQTEIREMLAAAGLLPEKRYGQHFLVDGNLMRLLVDKAELTPADTVLEVGPGVGNLTELLIEQAGWVVAVEIDPEIATVARARLAGAENLDLLVRDVLADKHHLSPTVVRTVEERRKSLGGPAKLVANLPYAAATPLVAELVTSDRPPERLVFTVQEEVALRMVAGPSTPDYGPIGVVVQAVAEVEVLRRLAPSVFWPRPKVCSSMVRVRPSAERRGRIADLAVFRRIVEGLFAHRRKRAAKSLALAERESAEKPRGQETRDQEPYVVQAPDPLRPPRGEKGTVEKGAVPFSGRMEKGTAPFSGTPAKGAVPFSPASPEDWAARLTAACLDPEARGEAYSVDEIIALANLIASARP